MTLATQLIALAERIAQQFNSIAGRLLPPGGTNGQILVKTDSEDGVAWSTPGYLEDAPNDGKMYVRQNQQWVEYPPVSPN